MVEHKCRKWYILKALNMVHMVITFAHGKLSWCCPATKTLFKHRVIIFILTNQLRICTSAWYTIMKVHIKKKNTALKYTTFIVILACKQTFQTSIQIFISILFKSTKMSARV